MFQNTNKYQKKNVRTKMFQNTNKFQKKNVMITPFQNVTKSLSNIAQRSPTRNAKTFIITNLERKATENVRKSIITMLQNTKPNMKSHAPNMKCQNVKQLTKKNNATNKYPKRVPLQTSRMYTDPIEIQDPRIKINVSRAEYDIPGRSMRMWMEIRNNGNESLRLGELTTANLRFINRDLIKL